jgi:hypothetical protein
MPGWRHNTGKQIGITACPQKSEYRYEKRQEIGIAITL